MVSILNMGDSFEQGLQAGCDPHLPYPFLFFLSFLFRFFCFLHRLVHLPLTQRGAGHGAFSGAPVIVAARVL